MQNISPIKQRILSFVDGLSISKRDFYAKTGISRGTLESNTGITEETLAKFIAFYPEVSSDWILKGKGDMLKKNGYAAPVEKLEAVNDDHAGYRCCQMCKEKDKLIATQAEYIELLKKNLKD